MGLVSDRNSAHRQNVVGLRRLPQFFGGRQAELLGRDYAALLPAEVAERQLALVRRVLAGGRSVRSEFRVADEGYETWINASYMPLKDDAGQVRRVLCIARDVTEQKELERNLIHTEKLASLGTLAAGFAHEINNPLGVILGFCELLLQKAEPGSQQREDLQVIERQGLHCKEIVDNLLSFARSEGRVTTACDLNDCVRDIVRVVRHSLGMQKIALELDLTDEIPPVRGDTRQLQQVLLNLITNAVAAMPDGGVLRLGTRFERAARQAVAFVRDSGAGIDPETMKHIFEPFYTTKPAGEGTGLGLFVSYGIVSRHGGTLSCVSRPAAAGRPGETTFTIGLPLHREDRS